MKVVEIISRRDAEAKWGSLIEPRKAPSTTTATPTTKHIIRKDEPTPVVSTKNQVAQNKEIIKQNKKYREIIIPKLMQRVKEIASRDNRYIDPSLLKKINDEDYLFPRTLEGDLLRIIPMEQRLQSLLDAYKRQESKLRDWVKYPARY